jgi:hypothetical protein
MQIGVAFARLHAAPHAPQWFASPARMTSQPSASLSPLQSANPGSHGPEQTPPVHACVTPAGEQTLPQPPQFCAFDSISVSQPFVSLSESQSANPAAQAPLQTPPTHDAVTSFCEHEAPQPPQFAASDAMLVSHPSPSLSPLQSANPAAQTPAHTPAVHAALMLSSEHAAPHAPQCIRSDAMFVSHPSPSLSPLQSAKPASHAPSQIPMAHDAAT